VTSSQAPFQIFQKFEKKSKASVRSGFFKLSKKSHVGNSTEKIKRIAHPPIEWIPEPPKRGWAIHQLVVQSKVSEIF
jgi:hypothetical protein